MVNGIKWTHLFLILSPTSIHQCRNEMSNYKKGAFNGIRGTYFLLLAKLYQLNFVGTNVKTCFIATIDNSYDHTHSN